MTLTIPMWLILMPVVIIAYVVIGMLVHAIVFYTSPYRSGKENGYGRGEDFTQLVANVIFWPLIAVSLPVYFKNKGKAKGVANRP